MSTKEQQRALGREVAAVFTKNPANKFVGFAGLGRHGGALILQEHDEHGTPKRKVVVKYSLGELTGDKQSDADADLRNEYHWLLKLRGAEHIGCQMEKLAYSAGVAAWDQFEEDVNAYIEGRERITERARKCPTFALEFLPNGQLSDTIQKHLFASENMPNRVLWRIWLCLVRQCVAMAYPPGIAMGAQDDGISIREEVKPDQRICRLCQNSAHLENWIWGPERDANIPDTDHDPHLPVVKVMMELAFPLADKDDLETEKQPRIYRCILEGEQREISTLAPRLLRRDERIDRAFRDVLVRSMTTNAGDAPTPEEALRNAIQHVAETPDATVVEESDDNLRRWTQRFLYDVFDFE
ncbi:hypothetical protein F5Y08DRAFT_342794 [Xylaria arbuscula]|nr:hypothetical protein F5Y08DRAFT_342794 [Xylaria arbuscula]